MDSHSGDSSDSAWDLESLDTNEGDLRGADPPPITDTEGKGVEEHAA